MLALLLLAPAGSPPACAACCAGPACCDPGAWAAFDPASPVRWSAASLAACKGCWACCACCGATARALAPRQTVMSRAGLAADWGSAASVMLSPARRLCSRTTSDHPACSQAIVSDQQRWTTVQLPHAHLTVQHSFMSQFFSWLQTRLASQGCSYSIGACQNQKTKLVPAL